MGSRVGPLKPTPAHSQMSLRDGMNFRLRGGIQIPAARLFSEEKWRGANLLRIRNQNMGRIRDLDDTYPSFILYV